MLWNFMMHALMGWLGAYFFLPTAERVGIAILVVCVTQAVDQIRIRKEKFAEIESLPKAERGQAGRELEQKFNRVLSKLFVQNVVIYTAVLLLTAHAARLNGWL